VPIDTAANRRSAAGVPFLPVGPGVTPDAGKPAAWRQQAGWGYSGIPAAQATPTAANPGGVFRRLGDVGRVFRRFGDVARLLRRLGGLARVFRSYPRMADTIQYDTRPKDASEVIQYVFDYSRFPEMKAGETLGTPVVDPVAGHTIGAPAVTTEDEVVDEAGTVVEAGKGIQVTISGGTAGNTYNLESRGTFSGGATRVVKGAVRVE
jgi:hypothetical protein